MLVLLFTAIYFQLLNNNKGNVLGNAFKSEFQLKQLLFLFSAFALISINFLCETKKWLTLTNLFYKLPFLKVYKAVLAGTTMAFFTPNRVGEYGGRVLFVPKKYIVETIAVTIIGGFAQQIITLLFGFVALFFLQDALLKKELFSETQFCLIALINMLLIVAFLLIYFNVKHVTKFLPKTKRVKKYFKKLKILYLYSKVTLSKVLLWAGLKYLIFSLQFYCLILAFGVPFEIEFIWLVMLSFLLQTVIPSVSLFELGVRGNVVLFTFGAFTHLKIEILTASVALWVINLLIPAIIGAFIILRIKIN